MQIKTTSAVVTLTRADIEEAVHAHLADKMDIEGQDVSYSFSNGRGANGLTAEVRITEPVKGGARKATPTPGAAANNAMKSAAQRSAAKTTAPEPEPETQTEESTSTEEDAREESPEEQAMPEENQTGSTDEGEEAGEDSTDEAAETEAAAAAEESEDEAETTPAAAETAKASGPKPGSIFGKHKKAA